jgi:sarcosine oxidase, subunit alpha
VWQGHPLHQVRAARFVFATGAIEQPLVFEGNDLPGVMLAGGARRLLALYAVRPGRRAVVATTCDSGLQAADALREAGVEIAALADVREGRTVLRAQGRKAVRRVTLGAFDGSAAESVDCDLLVVCGGRAPATSLLLQAGGEASYDPLRAQFCTSRIPEGSFAAGELIDRGERRAAILSGQAAGLEAALDLGRGEPQDAAALTRAQLELAALDHTETHAAAPTVSAVGRGRCFACLCEDVTAKDITRTVAEGYDSLELAKRYSTVFMGPCQGRMCQLPAGRLLAAATGQRLQDVGLTTARPPWSTVPMGALAGRPFEPAKRSPMHQRHRELGATVRWAGDWRRAYDYGDPEGEALAVHRASGLIDVSTLGKLLVRGPDAGAFLDRLYPNRLSNLKPGRIRYGVLASDAGRIIDDGTVCRLDEDSFYVTTTSSGAGAVEQWFAWWLADWRMDVRLTDLTQALGAVNLAGPAAREILRGLTTLDCAPEAFKYLDARHEQVAGVPCLLLRIGFVGELGYELHFPAAYGQDLWDRLLQAGETAGVRPFGLEPQRMLRLQKMHILVGQDTDSESTPFGAAMPWAVKLDKDGDFIGRWALEHASEQPPATLLVGFTVPDGVLPTEGAAVLDDDGAPAGQVTSARRSGQLDRVIGMAWVPAAFAVDGSQITISDGSRRLVADVVTRPFYDPDGEVLRS